MERHELLDLIRWLVSTMQWLTNEASCYCGFGVKSARDPAPATGEHDKFCLHVQRLFEQGRKAVAP
jgi:hypothetical protein